MKAYTIKLSGNWGHFRRPEANNNPISYDFIPKTAFIGLMSAVVGLTRDDLKSQYEALSKEILYTVEICNEINKIATNFRIYKYKGSLTGVENPPQFYEILKDPTYKISYFGNNELVIKFTEMIRNNQAHFQPTFGLANCPANIEFVEELELEQVINKQLKTRTLIPKENCNIKLDITSNKPQYIFSYDSIPTVQNNDWYNTKYTEVFYGYLPKDSYMVVEPSEYEHQYVDKDGLGYFFI